MARSQSATSVTVDGVNTEIVFSAVDETTSADTVPIIAENTASAKSSFGSLDDYMSAKMPDKKSKKIDRAMVYIGPMLPGGILKTNQIISGSVENYAPDLVAEYPQISHLTVPVTELAESRDKLTKSDNLLAQYYAELVETIGLKQPERRFVNRDEYGNIMEG